MMVNSLFSIGIDFGECNSSSGRLFVIVLCNLDACLILKLFCFCELYVIACIVNKTVVVLKKSLKF